MGEQILTPKENSEAGGSGNSPVSGNAGNAGRRVVSKSKANPNAEVAARPT